MHCHRNYQRPERIWEHQLYYFSLIVTPIGAFLWARGMWVAFGVLASPIPEGVSITRAVTIFLIFLFVALGALWILIGAFQSYILEPREIFISWWAHYKEGRFSLDGYYFKKASFAVDEVAKVEKYIADNHWFGPKGSWRYGTNLTRNVRAKHNYSLKVTLKDGRVFYFCGGMFEKDGPADLLDYLQWSHPLAIVTNTPAPQPEQASS